MTSLAHKISGWNRRRKWDLFEKTYDLTPDTKVLDVGFSEEEYSSNDNFIEKHYPFPSQLTALGVDTPVEFKKRYPEVKTKRYEPGEKFPFEDNEFDVCWSNAVVEHVGGYEDQIFFMKEVSRVAKKAFITTPNLFFPVEVHTRVPLLHILLSKKGFDRFLHLIGKGWAAGNYMRLLSKGDLKKLLKDCGIQDYSIVDNKLLGFTLDFVVIF